MLSIIVPVYNGEKYLKRCIDSLLESTIKEKEVIIVNDGSSDSSEHILAEFEKKYNNITVINQENSGVSAARNIGMQYTRGEYITFVDCDDWIEKDIYTYALDCIIKNNADMLQFGHSVVTDFRYKKKENKEGITIIQENIINQIFSDENYITPSICDKIFKREVINDLTFSKEYKYGEDITFLYEVLSKSSKVIICKKIGYYYFMHNESATQDLSKISLKKVQDSLETIEKAFEYSGEDIELTKKIEKRIFDGLMAWSQFLCRYSMVRTNEIKLIRGYIGQKVLRYKVRFLVNPYLSNFWKLGLVLTTRYGNMLVIFSGIHAFVRKVRGRIK